MRRRMPSASASSTRRSASATKCSFSTGMAAPARPLLDRDLAEGQIDVDALRPPVGLHRVEEQEAAEEARAHDRQAPGVVAGGEVVEEQDEEVEDCGEESDGARERHEGQAEDPVLGD